MIFSTEKLEKVLLVNFLQLRLDAKLAVEFKNTMQELIEAGNFDIILNLEKVEFIDSSGLGAIVTCLKTIGRRGDIVICCLSDDVEQMFTLTRMNKVFKIFKDLDSAVKSY